MLTLALFSIFVPAVVALWPVPHTLHTGSGALKLAHTFAVQLQAQESPPADLLAAISNAESLLKTDSFQRLVVGRASADDKAISHAPELPSLLLSLAPRMALPHRPPRRSQATLLANSSLGLFRGLSTFTTMWYASPTQKYILNAPVQILDEPAFLSVLYWHVVDSQSFPLDVTAFPELSAKGAYSDAEVYSTADVNNIVSYANQRGIDVVMELDSPGHTTGIAFAHPEHIACANKSPWSQYASEPPAGQLRIASNSTLSFALQMFDSVASNLRGPMMSSGGDEVNLPCWQEDEATVQDLEQSGTTIEDALNAFIQAVQAVLTARGKVPLIKSDMILTHNVSVTNDTIAVFVPLHRT
ncbi:hypothetical protein EW026_g6090 [Hermanssonia centrifuga]|uniref:beta-N-acetylhexosaminidase n=1 Tax=Hermanssonia centrifuga TaxID=98765 RepID=A0A4S4KC19_9APHY|nr:hypothetical protein EW026_g6090 [Hermanssonia centrifuga]